MLYHITCYASKNEKLVFASFERKEDHVIGLSVCGEVCASVMASGYFILLELKYRTWNTTMCLWNVLFIYTVSEKTSTTCLCCAFIC
jgi:hypothetical protein